MSLKMLWHIWKSWWPTVQTLHKMFVWWKRHLHAIRDPGRRAVCPGPWWEHNVLFYLENSRSLADESGECDTFLAHSQWELCSFHSQWVLRLISLITRPQIVHYLSWIPSEIHLKGLQICQIWSGFSTLKGPAVKRFFASGFSWIKVKLYIWL